MLDKTFPTTDTAFVAYLRVLGKDYQNAELINPQTVEFTVLTKHQSLFDKWQFTPTKNMTLIKRFHHFNRELVDMIKEMKGEKYGRR